MDEATLLKGLLSTDKLADVRGLIEAYTETQSAWTTWRPVGDRTNNSATIQAAGDPARSALERITNGVDANIEFQHTAHSSQPECRSPKEAAQAWFGIPSEGMHKLSPAALRKIAQETVTL